MYTHDRYVYVIQELVVELDSHAGAEEHHHFLFAILFQESKQEKEPLV